MKAVNLRHVIAVARWEFIEKVRTKAFVISLLVTPLFMLMFAVLPQLLSNIQNDKTTQFGVWDGTHGVATGLNESLASQRKLPDSSPRYKLILLEGKTDQEAVGSAKSRVFAGELHGIFVIPSDAEKTRIIKYYGENVGNIQDVSPILSTIEKAINSRQLEKYQVAPEVIRDIARETDVQSVKLSKDGSEEKTGFLEQIFGMYGSILIVMMMISMTGQIMVRSMLDEKSHRIIEILLSSCRPEELMMGKLLGLAGLGLVQGLMWVIISGGAALFIPFMASFLTFLPVIITFALLGYFFYAALLIGLGSTTTTEQEAQAMTGYAIMLSALPFALISVLLRDPSGALARIASFIPFLTPSVMSARIFLQTPPWWEITLGILSMLAWIVIVTFVSAKIFRVGILTYGKKMTMKEIIAAVKAK